MQCQKAHRKISAYMDGELDADSFRSMERHMRQCEACQKTAADFKEVNALVRALPKLDLGPDFAGQLLEEVGSSPARELSDRRLLAPLVRFLSGFMDLLEGKHSPRTHALDEFGDFPPFSMGYVYFQLLDQKGRG